MSKNLTVEGNFVTFNAKATVQELLGLVAGIGKETRGPVVLVFGLGKHKIEMQMRVLSIDGVPVMSTH